MIPLHIKAEKKMHEQPPASTVKNLIKMKSLRGKKKKKKWHLVVFLISQLHRNIHQ